MSREKKSVIVKKRFLESETICDGLGVGFEIVFNVAHVVSMKDGDGVEGEGGDEKKGFDKGF